ESPSWIRQIQEVIHLNRNQGVQLLCEKVEACEKRKDSQIWREFEFALPRELTDAQNLELGTSFLQEQVCGRGIGALLNFHFDVDSKTGERKPHCHALLLTRRINEAGFSSHKERSWNSKELVHTLREQYEATTNFHLKLHGHDARIDTRSYQEQGLELEGQGKFGSNVREMEQRGFVTRRLASFELSGLRNVYRILKRPEILLESVTRHHTTFTWGTVQSVLERYVKQESLFSRLEVALRTSPELVLLKLGQEMDGRDSVYTTQTLLKAEVALAETLERLSTSQKHPVSSVVLKEVLKNFGEADGVTSSVSVQVQEAIHHVTLGHQVSCLVGAAGTGKTSVIAKAQRIWEDSGYRVMGLAPTGRAARNLQEAGVFSQTIHRLLGDLASGRQQVSSKTVWVVDEAGMVDTLKFRELFAWAETLGVKVVLLGDSAQLQPVGAGAFFRWATDFLHEAGELARLETVLRQRASWQREATQLFAFGRTEEAVQAYHQAGKLKLVEFSRQDAREALLSAWSEALGAHPQETLLMLAHSNQDVEALNQGARHLLQQLGKVSVSECSLMVQQMRMDGLDSVVKRH
ncbi:MAG: AAA family ATPase, partial [Alphaproteobacteria bacterium]